MLYAQVADDPERRQALDTADVVLVSVGRGDGPPWPSGGSSPPPQARSAGAQVASIVDERTPTCVDRSVAGRRPALRGIFEQIRAVAPAVSALLALSVYDSWMGSRELEDSLQPGERARFSALLKRAFDSWNSMLCAEAVAANFTCVDVCHAFNGSDGLAPVAAHLRPSGEQPPQRGQGTIAALLAAVDLGPVDG